MNEKIKELSALAQEKLIDPITGEEYYSFSRMKFAELIVRECVDICQQATEQNNQTYAMLKEDELAEKMVIHGSIKQAEKLAQGIKQHFGVEELQQTIDFETQDPETAKGTKVEHFGVEE